VAIAANALATNQGFKSFVLQPGLLPDYIYYYLRRARELAVSLASGTTFLELSGKDAAKLPVPVPPLGEQRRIVDAVESLLPRVDEAEAALERVQRNLKRYRAAVLQAAVEGRLVPTEAELARAEGRDYEQASELLKRILTERRHRWEEAELARLTAAGRPPKDDRWKTKYEEAELPVPDGRSPLPEGWAWATWGQIGLSQNGRAFPSGEYQAKGIRLLRPGNLHASGSVEWTPKNTRHMPEGWADEYPEYVVGPGELVMNLTAQSLKDEFLGRVCITGHDERCLLNQRIARLSPVLVASRFILSAFKAPVFRRFVDSLNKGSLIQHMFTSQLASWVLPLPPLPEQERIATEVERHASLALALESAAAVGRGRAKRLRQSILKWAFEGKLVDQDPNDEPASVLLERIRAERDTGPGERSPSAAGRRARSDRNALTRRK
jgi:type I restriction enzyme S subunit